MKNQGLIGALRLFAVFFIFGGGFGVIYMLAKAQEVGKYSNDAEGYFIFSAMGVGLLVAAVSTIFFGIAQILEEVSQEFVNSKKDSIEINSESGMVQPEAPTKTCPACEQPIKIESVKCCHCGRRQPI